MNVLARFRQWFTGSTVVPEKPQPKPTLTDLMDEVRVTYEGKLASALQAAELALACGLPNTVVVEGPCPDCRTRAEQQMRWRIELIAELAALNAVKRKPAESGIVTVPLTGIDAILEEKTE